jgi:multiple sugar transport system ATP-binding protein
MFDERVVLHVAHHVSTYDRRGRFDDGIVHRDFFFVAVVSPSQQSVLSGEGGGGSMAEVTFTGVGKAYPDGTRAVSALDLEIEDREFMVLVGPSGCGKTTALRMVAGLEDITEGELRIGDRAVNHVPSRDRDIAMVFQSYALYPHLSVYENIAFGLKLKKMPKDEIDRRVREAAHVLDLDQWLERKPRNLSGGQRQRVAMGRAIVRQPAAFLMDEPLSNLDAKLRVQMRAEIARLQQDLGVTTLYVTHDQVEAMTMGDRVAVMRKGELQQVAPPQVLYDRPVNLFVAGFIGSPAMNMLDATLERSGDAYTARLGEQTLSVAPELAAQLPALAGYVGKQVVLGIRPEDIADGALVTDAPPDRRLRAEVTLREALGSEVIVHAKTEARVGRGSEMDELASEFAADGVHALHAKEDRAMVIGRFSPRSAAEAGDSIELVIDTGALHFFDSTTGLGIYEAPTQGAQ